MCRTLRRVIDKGGGGDSVAKVDINIRSDKKVGDEAGYVKHSDFLGKRNAWLTLRNSCKITAIHFPDLPHLETV